MQTQITKETMNQVEENANRNLMETKVISVEEFMAIFEERFNERVISIHYNNGFAKPGITFEQATAIWYADNTIHFYESDGEVPYEFPIDLDGLDHIEMIDYWLDHAYPEIDLGAKFAFVGKDNSQILIDADK